MNTIAVDSNIYQGAERYAKLHNVNLKQLVEEFLMKLQMPSSYTQKWNCNLLNVWNGWVDAFQR